MSNNLIRKFFEYAVGSGLVLVLGFISSPINTRLFSPDEYGKYSMYVLFYSIVSTIVLFGYDQSFVRFYYDETSDNRKYLLKETLKIPLILTLFVCIIIILFADVLLTTLFDISNNTILFFLVLSIFVQTLNKFVFSVLRMEDKATSFSKLQVIQKILTIIFTLLLYNIYNDSFLVLLIAFVLANFIVTVIGIKIEKKYWTFDSKFSNLNTSSLEIFKFGFPLIFTFLITWLFQSTDKIFIKIYDNFTELGIYSAAFSIIALLNSIQIAFSMFWTPVAYRKFKDNPDDYQFFKNMSNIIAFIMLTIGILLILFRDGVVLLLGSEYRDAGFIMPFLILMPIMYCVSETTVVGINFLKKSRFHIYIAFTVAVFNLIGNIILVPSLGAKGAAISTGISYVIFYLLRSIISKKLYYIEYGIAKFLVCTFFIILFAFYASFNSSDFIFYIFGFSNIILVILLYKNETIYFKKNICYFLSGKIK